MTPYVAGAVVAALATAIHDGRGHEYRVPLLLEALLAEEGWRLTQGRAGWVEHDHLVEWITEATPHGLGTTVEHLVALCAGHPAVLAALEAAVSDGAVLDGNDLSGQHETVGS